MDLFEYQGKQFFASFGIPVSAGRRRRHRRRRRGGRRGASATRSWSRPRCRWAAGARRAASSWPTDADEVRDPRRHHPRHGHQGPHRRAALDRAGLRHRRGVLRQLHPRPLGQEAPRACSRPRAASRSRRWPRRTPTPSPGSTSIRSTGSPTDAGPVPGWRRPSSNPDATDGAVDILQKLYRAYVEGDADLVEINPLILTPDGRVHALDAKVTLDGNAAFRHEWAEYEATQERDEREQAGPREGPPVRRPRRHVGIIANGAGLAMSTRRRRQPGGRRPGQLPRHRRRRQRRGDGQRPRGHQQRPEGAVDLHQHLRRHHQGRGGGQRHRPGPRPGRHRLADRDPPRRHQRRGGPGHPRRARVGPTRLQAHDARRQAPSAAVRRWSAGEDGAST